jgi:hypothetical protein
MFIFSIKLVIAFFLIATNANAQPLCPSESITDRILENELSKLTSQQKALQTIQKGKENQYFIIQTLFPINLEDDQALFDYQKEIESILKNRNAHPESLVSIVACQDQLTVEQNNDLNKARSHYQTVLREQLQILKLPEVERVALLNPKWERIVSLLQDPKLNLRLIQLGIEQAERQTEREKLLAQKDLTSAEFVSKYYELQEELFLLKISFLLQLKQTQNRTIQNINTLDEAFEKLNSSEKWQPQLSVNLNLLINPLWRDFVSRSLNSYQLEEQVPSFTPIQELTVLMDENEQQEQMLLSLIENQEEVLALRHQIIEENHRSNLELLLKASLVRSLYLKKSREFNNTKITDWEPSTYEDLKKELKVIPHRFSALIYHKILEFKHKFTFRQNSWTIIFKDVLTFLFIILIPYLAWAGINKVSKLLDQAKENIILKSNLKTTNLKLAIWIGRLNPFIPWVVGIVGLELIDQITAGTAFEELSTLTPYLKFFFFYRIFRRIVVLLLTQMTSIGSLSLSRENRVKINSSAKNVALFTLIIFVIMHTIESVVGQGLIYVLALYLIKIISLLMGFIVAHQWRHEAARLLQLEISPYSSIDVEGLIRKKKSLFLSLPLIIITVLVMLSMMALRWGSEFDLSKRFSAKLFRRKLESAEKNLDHFDDEMPEDYKKCFDNSEDVNQSIMFKYRQDVIQEIRAEINEWFEEKTDEHSLALYGEAGIGQSSLLKIIEKSYPNLKVINVTLTGKFSNKGQLQRYLGELLDVNLEKGLSELVSSDEKREPTLVLIDKCHQMFLSEVGGFEAFREFLDIINAQTKNIFWCSTFNIYSWQYLNRVYGKNHYFRTIKKIQPWTEEDIRSMILERHELSGFKISYQDILKAAKTSDDNATVDFVETKFFRLLWEQSNGNPKTAIELWFSALKYIKPNKLKVGLPYSFRPKILNELQDDASFVFHEILKHGDLTFSELKAVLNMGDGIIQYALKLGLENDLLDRTRGGRYSVNSLMQPVLINSLRKKNLIYG